VIGKVTRGRRVPWLLAYLYGPGRRNEHVNPRTVAGFDDPGWLDPPTRPDGRRVTGRLAELLEQPLRVYRRGTPRLAVYAATLQQGRLLADWPKQALREPPKHTRQQIQATALGDYPTRRDQAVQARWEALPWLTRRRTDPAELAAAHNAEHLQACDTCGILTPTDEWDQPHDDECRHCGSGHRVAYSHRDQVPTLAQRLDQIRAQLRVTDPRPRRPPGAAG